MQLFRSMKEEVDGLPAAGPSGRMLGVRPGNHSTPDVQAARPSDIVLPGQGGLSVAPDDPMHLQRHRRPVSLGGIGRDPVWYIDTADLSPDVCFRQDRPNHGLIEPAQTMTLQAFQDILAQTRSRWKLHCR